MITIVEGPDNSGKSTLIKKILEQFQPSKEAPSLGPHPEKGLMGQFREDLNSAKEAKEQGISFVFDRIPPISEEIYGPICRGKSRLTPKDLDNSWDIIHKLSPVIIYCRPDREVITGSINDREQMNGVVNNIDAIINGYDSKFFKLLSIPYIKERILIYDYMVDPEAEELMMSLNYHLHLERGKL